MKLNYSSAATALLLVLVCIWRLDLPLAGWVADHLRAQALYAPTSAIPDLLPASVALLTALSWLGYFYLLRRNIRDHRTRFCRMAGTVLPLAFGVKTVLKWLFGRTETRHWLFDPSSYGFHWLAGTWGFQGFPSGHMLVFTSFFLAAWHFFPAYRLHCSIALLSLAAALVATDYHFLGDVVAGAYVGALVYAAVSRVLERS